MAAERAAELSDKAVRVVPSRSQQARAGRRASRSIPARGARGQRRGDGARRSTHVRTGGVAAAARDDAEGTPARFRRGDAVGFVDERPRGLGRAGGDAGAVLGDAGAARPSWSR